MRRFGLAPFVPFALLVTQPAFAQATRDGRLLITVVDQSNAVLPGATVTATGSENATAKVTLAIYRRVGGTWSLFTTRDAYVNAIGVASYTWTFSARGEWYVRSIANPTTFNANSVWSPVERYSVR